MTQRDLFPLIPEEIRARASRAMADPAITPCAFQVLTRLIRFPEAAGRERAISIADLQAWARLNGFHVYSDREIKAAVKQLIEEHDVPIGSVRYEPAGYFVLCSAEDIEIAERPILGEIRSLARRLRCTNPKSEISRTLCGQMGIE